MLRFIRIRDFALISELEVEFGPGLNLLSGETGSGKSILVDALGLLLGERASQEMVRTGSDQAVIEGVFTLESAGYLSNILKEAGIAPEDDLLLIRREIFSNGRNRVFINNTLVTLTLLKAVGDRLADIHGQNDHQALLQVGAQLDFLDSYGNNGNLAQEVEESYRRLQEIARRLKSIQIDEQDRLRKIDILQFQLDEIRRAQPGVREKEELEVEKSVLSNSERIFSLANEIYSRLYESDQSMVGQANRISRMLEELAGFDSRWGAHREALTETIYNLEDLALFARDYSAGMDFSPERLEVVEQRLSLLERLASKYGHSVAEILQYADKCEHELEDLTSLEDRHRHLESQLESELKQYQARAQKLSEKRQKAARQLERELKRELQALSMESTKFVVRFQPLDSSGQEPRIPAHFGTRGIDRVEFLVSPNLGEEPKPLARTASGGELSRIVLALKSLCSGADSNKTLVFDEVDVGIGGRVAEVVGRRLRSVSSGNQVLCVTHLPQIAAYATQHYIVRKEAVGSRTETSVQRLNESERVQELARMLGGETITETTRRHAREMLNHSLSSIESR
jgi:DNA repair protein RecN (Recombination protein N)